MRLIGLCLVAGLMCIPARAAVINDGSTTANLVRLSNANGLGSAEMNLTAAEDGTLLASQTGQSIFATRTTWYAANAAPTSGVYQVSAVFRPAEGTAEQVGGVAGWLNLETSRALAFQVIPEESFFPKAFRVSVIDFASATANGNDTTAGLYQLDGTPAEAAFGSAWSAPGTNYVASNRVTLRIEFQAPGAADMMAVSNVTARLTARAFQTPDGGTNAVAVCDPIELLTTLPVPAQDQHRIGYFAVWLSIFLPGSDIGYLDDLSAEGGIGVPSNAPPLVQLTQPANGAVFTAPATVTLEATASDPDGVVSRVEFYAGTTLLGSVTNSPYRLDWNGVAAGTYTLTARAVDGAGLSGSSAPATITVNPPSGDGPLLTIGPAAGGLEITWPSTGYTLQENPNLNSNVWTDYVPSTAGTNRVVVPVTGTERFFRLAQ